MPRTPIEPLRWWVQKVLPTVYDDSLSFQELLGKVVDKLNEVIRSQNNLSDELVEFENHINEIVGEYITEAEVVALIDALADNIEVTYLKNKSTSGLHGYTHDGSAQGEMEIREGDDLPSGEPYAFIVKTGNDGMMKCPDPITDYHVANKQYVDGKISTELTEPKHDIEVLQGQMGDVGQQCFELNRDKLDKRTTDLSADYAYIYNQDGQGARLITQDASVGSIVQRGVGGRSKIGTPVSSDDIANKEYVDNNFVRQSNETTGIRIYYRRDGSEGTIEASTSATSPTGASQNIPIRINGTIRVTDPVYNTDAVNKQWFLANCSGNFVVTPLVTYPQNIGVNTQIASNVTSCKALMVTYKVDVDSGFENTAFLYLTGNGQYLTAVGWCDNDSQPIFIKITRTVEQDASLTFTFSGASTLSGANVKITGAWGVNW